jgi:methylenetetrahydrofolate reductase (NADH)
MIQENAISKLGNVENCNALLRIPASIEVTPRQAIESVELPGLFPAGTRVYIVDIGIDNDENLVGAAKRVRDLGYVPVPHFAARRLTTRVALEDRVKAMTQDAGVQDVLIIAGGLNKPGGTFSSSIEVLETGLFDKYGIEDIGIAGHPEGSPDFTDEVALEVLKLKASLEERSNARFRIVTQFGFDAAKLIDWAEGLNTHGIRMPVHLGVAGPAKLTTLIKYAAVCGVGNSLSMLKKRSSLTTLVTRFSPDSIVEPVEKHVATKPSSAIKQIHVFPFGGIANAATWLRERGSWAQQQR